MSSGSLGRKEVDTTTDYSPNGRDTEVRRPVVMRLCYLAARFSRALH
jgi:hypothetical protein